VEAAESNKAESNVPGTLNMAPPPPGNGNPGSVGTIVVNPGGENPVPMLVSPPIPASVPLSSMSLPLMLGNGIPMGGSQATQTLPVQAPASGPIHLPVNNPAPAGPAEGTPSPESLAPPRVLSLPVPPPLPLTAGGHP
jgi:hypothetical protein